MADQLRLKVNGLSRLVNATIDTPLLYVLRNELGFNGPLFGCGLAQCGACAVLYKGQELRSCVTPVGAVLGDQVHTLEGLPALWSNQTGVALKQGELHPIQQAWIDEQVPQCAYCQSGMMIQAVALLGENKAPTDLEIRQAMNGHLCRCGTQLRIISAIKRAAPVVAKGGKS
jgi:aerobic-type carbon monoxide dehydrogenase small subunit (CoxS/CutS family)